MRNYIFLVCLSVFSLLFMGCPDKLVFVDLNVYSINGTVSNSSSAALSGVKVYTSPATNTVYTDASGNYSITSIAAGTYTVYAELTGYNNYSTSVTVSDSQTYTQNISMTIVSASSITGKVTNSSSAALSGVKVYTSPATNTVYTDASGNYSITSIAAGTYTVYAELTGYNNYSTSVTVSQSLSYTQNISMSAAVTPTGFVFVEGGTYTMGDSQFATPLHTVTLSSYYISKTEVTQGQYKAVMGTNPSYFSSVGDNGPVEQVTWYDCISYCNKLSLQQGKTPCYSISGNTSPSDWTNGTIVCNFTAKGYRLATEAEWEYAARGGNKSAGYTYSGSNTVDAVAWYTSNSGSTTHAVGTKIANELGINDMSGNVWEWCWDWYSSYTSSSQTNPTGASSGSYRVLRGGSWYSSDSGCHSSNRGVNFPDFRYNYNGFRLVQGF